MLLKKWNNILLCTTDLCRSLNTYLHVQLIKHLITAKSKWTKRDALVIMRWSSCSVTMRLLASVITPPPCEEASMLLGRIRPSLLGASASTAEPSCGNPVHPTQYRRRGVRSRAPTGTGGTGGARLCEHHPPHHPSQPPAPTASLPAVRLVCDRGKLRFNCSRKYLYAGTELQYTLNGCRSKTFLSKCDLPGATYSSTLCP